MKALKYFKTFGNSQNENVIWDEMQTVLADYFDSGSDDVLLINLNEAIRNDWSLEDQYWVGVIFLPTFYTKEYYLEQISSSSFWQKQSSKCCGIFVSGEPVRKMLKLLGYKLPIGLLPTLKPSQIQQFDLSEYQLEKSLMLVGAGKENIDSLGQHHSNAKLSVLGKSVEALSSKRDLRALQNLTKDFYIQQLSTNVVIVYDSELTSLSVIKDCILSGTPVLISAGSAHKECLGPQYPLVFSSEEELLLFLSDLTYLQMGIDHLARIRERYCMPDQFIKQLSNSSIYRELPKRIGFTEKMVKYDVSIFLYFNQRASADLIADNISNYAKQVIDEKFELIIWNDDSTRIKIFEEVYAPFAHIQNIKLLQPDSSLNAKAISAMASLVRSPFTLIQINEVSQDDKMLIRFFDHFGCQKNINRVVAVSSNGDNEVLGISTKLFKKVTADLKQISDVDEYMSAIKNVIENSGIAIKELEEHHSYQEQL